MAEQTERFLAEVGTKAALAMAKAASEGKPPISVFAEGAIQVIPSVTSRIVGAWEALRGHQTKTLLEHAGIALGGRSAEDVFAFIEEHADDEWTQRTVFESMRALLDSLDEAVIPALGRLTGEYLAGERKPDRLFRGLSRLLADLSGEEFLSFQALVRDVSQAPVAFDPIPVFLQSVVRRRPWPIIHTSDSEGRHWTIWLSDVPHIERIFHLIQIHAIGRENPADLTIPDGPAQTSILRSRAGWICRIVQPPPAPPPEMRRAEEGAPSRDREPLANNALQPTAGDVRE